MVVVFEELGLRVFANVWCMFGGLCVHVATGEIYTFSAEGPDETLWLYRGGNRSACGFVWSNGNWQAVAERVNGFIHILDWGLWGFEGDDYTIDSRLHLLPDDVLERRPRGETPPNPFQVF